MLTREGARLFGGRPVAVVGATPGGFGTVQAQDAMLSVLRAFGCDAWFGGRLMLSHASAAFDADGHLTEEKLLNQLRSFVEGFVAHIRHRSNRVLCSSFSAQGTRPLLPDCLKFRSQPILSSAIAIR